MQRELSHKKWRPNTPRLRLRRHLRSNPHPPPRNPSPTPLDRINPDLHEDADLSGPILFYMLFGLCQLLGGKVHFGVILGWTTLASLFLYTIFNLLAGKNGSLDFYRCVSLVGYCLIPMVLLSAFSIFLPRWVTTSLTPEEYQCGSIHS